MGKEDIGLKLYFSDARRYADLWNGSVFGGREIIKAEKLQEVNPVMSKADHDAVLQKTCDIVMKQDNDGQRFVILTVENQKTIDYGMPVRIMLQEALEYHKQVKEIERKNKKASQQQCGKNKPAFYHDAGEFLYKVRKEDRLHPVVTLIVYWGEEEWKGAKSLHEMIDFGDESKHIDQELKKLIPEYPLHFLDLTEFDHLECFKTELRPLLELYKRRNDKKEFVEYVKTSEEQWNMDDETWYMLSLLTHSKELENLIKNRNVTESEKKSMCKAIEDLKNDAIAEGRVEGKIEGKVEGKAEYIIELLEECGEVPDHLCSKILAQKDLDILKKWHKLSAKVSTVQEFVEKM